ncbi:Ribonuclease HI [Candidatus Methanophagaceae archaeon]|jgi:ribonuclease HI|nr:Ribonuclease HI [Methanophagales archaeon]
MNKIQFDGAAIPNPGDMGIGAVLIENKRIIAKISTKLPDKGTNNIAEYTALLTGITKALALGWKQVIIEGDSKLVINQVKCAWKINKEHLKRLHAQVIKELSKFDSYALNWIPRNKNSVADELASKALGHKEDKYHRAETEIKEATKIKIEAKCPKCNGDCIFKWQEFNDGSRHIRQECPVHGFIRYAPKIEPYLTIVTQAKKKTIQKKIGC